MSIGSTAEAGLGGGVPIVWRVAGDASLSGCEVGGGCGADTGELGLVEVESWWASHAGSCVGVPSSR